LNQISRELLTEVASCKTEVTVAVAKINDSANVQA